MKQLEIKQRSTGLSTLIFSLLKKNDIKPIDYIYKTHSIGVSFFKPMMQYFCFLGEFHIFPHEPFWQGYHSVLVGQVARVHNFIHSFKEKEIANDIFILDERLSDVIDLKASVFSIGVRKKCDSFMGRIPGHNINTFTTLRSPDGVELCLDEYLWPLPNRPPDNQLTAMGSDVFFNNRKAFILWLAKNWGALNNNGILSIDASTKLFGMSGIMNGRDHMLNLSPRNESKPPNARAKGRGRTELGQTGQSMTPRPLERRVGRRTRKEWLFLLAFRSFRRAQRKEMRPTYLALGFSTNYGTNSKTI